MISTVLSSCTLKMVCGVYNLMHERSYSPRYFHYLLSGCIATRIATQMLYLHHSWLRSYKCNSALYNYCMFSNKPFIKCSSQMLYLHHSWLRSYKCNSALYNYCMFSNKPFIKCSSQMLYLHHSWLKSYKCNSALYNYCMFSNKPFIKCSSHCGHFGIKVRHWWLSGGAVA